MIFYLRVVKIKVLSSSQRVMFCLLYSPKQKNCINTKSHVIDIFTSEDMENISLCIFQYLTVYFSVSHSLLCNKNFYLSLIASSINIFTSQGRN
jgi:hypothetical protein